MKKVISVVVLLTVLFLSSACQSETAQDFSAGPEVSEQIESALASVNPSFDFVQLSENESQTVRFTLATAEIPPQKVDVLFLFDVTGSMGEVLGEAKENGVQIMNSLAASYPDIAFGVASFADFDSYTEYENDYPWRLDLDINSNISGNANVINELSILNGGDSPESTLTALWNSTEIGWRSGSRRIIVLFSDAPVHDPEFYLAVGGSDFGLDPGPDAMLNTSDDLRMETTIQHLADNGISVFTVYASAEPNEILQYGFKFIADETGGKVFNLENASDLSRILEKDLRDSIETIGILTVDAISHDSENLKVTVSPERYTHVEGGESREFTVQITSAEKINRATESIVELVFLADENPVASANITVGLANSSSNSFWWWLVGIILLISVLANNREKILAILQTEKIYILVHHQDIRETRIKIHDGFLIGSDTDSDLVLTEVGVEAKHARLRISDGKWLIASPGGAENIVLDDRRIDAAVLKPGDDIQLGDAHLKFRVEKAPKESGIEEIRAKNYGHSSAEGITKFWNISRERFYELDFRQVKVYWECLSEWFMGLGNLRWFVLAGAVVITLILFWPNDRKVESPDISEALTDSTAPIPTNTSAPVLTPTPVPSVGSTIISEIDGMKMVYVPAGEFQMGSDSDIVFDQCDEIRNNCKRDWFEDEEPVTKVYLDAYWIDQTEVTNAMYEKCVAKGECDAPFVSSSAHRDDYYGNIEFSNYPVIAVSYYDANAYCLWAGRRLPTEAEWEKAARGGLEGKLYPWGNDAPVCEYGAENGAKFNDKANCENTDTEPVGSYAPNGYGIFDMAGNVDEWTSSLHYSYPYVANDGRENTSSAFVRVPRGGSWGSVDIHIRSAGRYGFRSDDPSNFIGFRCVLSP